MSGHTGKSIRKHKPHQYDPHREPNHNSYRPHYEQPRDVHNPIVIVIIILVIVAALLFIPRANEVKAEKVTVSVTELQTP